MPSLQVPAGVQVRVSWLFGTQAANNILAGQVQAGFVANQTIANSLATAFRSALTTSGLAAVLHSSTSLVTVGLRDVRSPNLPEFVGTGAGTPGTGSNGVLPRQNAGVVTLRTAMAGPSFRGRVFLGGFDRDANTTAGVISAASMTAMGNFVTALQSAMSAQGITLAVMHRPVWDQSVPPQVISAGFVTPVSAIVVRDNVWDSQRRRR